MRLTGNAKRINRKPVPRTTTTDPVIPNNRRGTIPQERKNPLPRKNNKVDKCNGTPSPCVGNSVATCNKISGCHFLLGYWYGGIYTPTKCWEPPTPCSNFNDDKARCVKQGCTYRKPKSSSRSSSSIFKIVGFVVAGVAGVVLIGGIVALITWHIFVIVSDSAKNKTEKCCQ